MPPSDLLPPFPPFFASPGSGGAHRLAGLLHGCGKAGGSGHVETESKMQPLDSKVFASEYSD